MDKIEFYPELARACAAEPSRTLKAESFRVLKMYGKELWALTVRCNGRIIADCLTDASSSAELAAEEQLLLDLTLAHFAGVQ